MRHQVPDAALSQTLTWIWLVAVVVGFVIFAIWRWWRHKHPKPKPERKLSYSESLAKRLATARHGKVSKRQHAAAAAEGAPRAKQRPGARPPA